MCFNIKIYRTILRVKLTGSPWRVGIMPAPKMSVIGDSIRLVPAGSPALFELSALGFSNNEIDVQIISMYSKSVIYRI